MSVHFDIKPFWAAAYFVRRVPDRDHTNAMRMLRYLSVNGKGMVRSRAQALTVATEKRSSLSTTEPPDRLGRSVSGDERAANMVERATHGWPRWSKGRVLLGYRQRNLPQIHGVLRSISADSLIDERSGGSYFLAKVEVDRASLEALGAGIKMLPGMPAEIMLMGDEQTLFDYLVAPITASLDHSFRQ